MPKKKNRNDLIRRAVVKNHGGMETANDNQILNLWRSLDKITQDKYLENLKETKTQIKGKKENAVSDKSESQI